MQHVCVNIYSLKGRVQRDTHIPHLLAFSHMALIGRTRLGQTYKLGVHLGLPQGWLGFKDLDLSAFPGHISKKLE